MTSQAERPKSFLLPGAKKHYAPNLLIVPTHLDINLEIDIPKRKCICEVTMTVKANSHPQTKILELNAVGFLNLIITPIPSVISNTTTSSSGGSPSMNSKKTSFSMHLSEDYLTYRYDGEKITLLWDEPFQPCEQRKLLISYMVIEPIDGLFFSSPDQSYPKRSTYVISDHETERARYWLPCIDSPSVRTTLDFYLTALEEYTIVANGKFISETTDSRGMKTCHWSLDFPCPAYLIAFAVGNLVMVEDESVDSMPIAYLAVEGTPKELLFDCFRETPKMVRWLSKKLNSPFPFRNIKYYQIAAPHIPVAMECISLVTWNDSLLFDEVLGQERRLTFDLINVHELAHSYFGDSLVIRHFEHAWLKESWATYIEALWIQDHLGEDHFSYEMEMQADLYIKETTNHYVRPIVTREYNSSWNMFDQHLYPGGSWRVHMLREMLGEEVFWKGVREYVDENSVGVVTTTEWLYALENSSSRSLIPFFDQWIYGLGFPKLEGQFRFDIERKEIRLMFEQIQPSDWTTFDLNLDIEITCDNGEIFTSRVIFQDQRRASSTISIGDSAKLPTQIRIDPKNKYLFSLQMNPGEDILGETAMEAKDITNRIWACCELINIGSYSSMKKLEEAIMQEKFYGVRVKISQKLAEAKSILAARLLSKMLSKEQDPMALHQIANNCRIKDRHLRETILSMLSPESSKTLPYLAYGSLLVSLACQHEPKDIPFLIEEAKADREGYQSHITAGAYRALSETRNEEAFEYLISRVEYGVEKEELRSLVVLCSAKCATFLNRTTQASAANVIVNLLRDDDYRVRTSAVEALVLLGAKDKINDIECLKPNLAQQNYSWLDRKISILKSSGDETNAIQLRIELENLENKIQLLQERIRLLENK